MKKVLKVLGWIMIPYIMIFVFWKRLSKSGRTIGIIYSVIIISVMVNETGGDNSTKTTYTPVSSTNSTTNTTSVNNNKATTQNKSEETAMAKQKADQQAAAQKKAQENAAEQQKAKLDAEMQQLKNNKNATYQEKMKVMRDYINIDKSDILAKNPTVQDMGFAGDLFIQINKPTVMQLNSVGSQLISQQANGIFWEVNVTLNDAGSNPIQANTDMFTLTTPDGRTYSTDTQAELMISKPVILDTLNPGVDDTGYLIFDVPQDLNISGVMLNVQNGLFNNVKLRLS